MVAGWQRLQLNQRSDFSNFLRHWLVMGATMVVLGSQIYYWTKHVHLQLHFVLFLFLFPIPDERCNNSHISGIRIWTNLDISSLLFPSQNLSGVYFYFHSIPPSIEARPNKISEATPSIQLTTFNQRLFKSPLPLLRITTCRSAVKQDVLLFNAPVSILSEWINVFTHFIQTFCQIFSAVQNLESRRSLRTAQ